MKANDREDNRATPYANTTTMNRFRSGARHNSIDDGSRTQPMQGKFDRWPGPNGERTSVGAMLNPKYSFGNQFRTFHEAKDMEVREKDQADNTYGNARMDKVGMGTRAPKA